MRRRGDGRDAARLRLVESGCHVGGEDGTRARERALSLLEKELQAATKAVEDAREVARDLERRREVLDETD